MDPLGLLIGAGLLVVGYLAGRAHRRPSQPKRVEPICSCEHGLAYHDRETGHCHWQGAEDRFSSIKGNYQVEVKCSCRRYVGPEHIADVWAPEITTGER